MSLLGEKPTSAFLPLSVFRALQPLAVLTLKTWRRPRAGGEWGCVPLLARSQVCKPCHCLVEPSEVVTLAQRPGMRSLAEPSVCRVAPELPWAPGTVVPGGPERERAQVLVCPGLKGLQLAGCLLLFLNTLRSLRPRQFRGESLLDRCVPSYRC